MPPTGGFEISENGQLIVSGSVYEPKDPVLSNFEEDEILCHTSSTTTENGGMPLSKADVYKELGLRGYDYGPTFQGILSASNKGLYFRISLCSMKLKPLCDLHTSEMLIFRFSVKSSLLVSENMKVIFMFLDSDLFLNYLPYAAYIKSHMLNLEMSHLQNYHTYINYL